MSHWKHRLSLCLIMSAMCYTARLQQATTRAYNCTTITWRWQNPSSHEHSPDECRSRQSNTKIKAHVSGHESTWLAELDGFPPPPFWGCPTQRKYIDQVAFTDEPLAPLIQIAFCHPLQKATNDSLQHLLHDQHSGCRNEKRNSDAPPTSGTSWRPDWAKQVKFNIAAKFAG